MIFHNHRSPLVVFLLLFFFLFSIDPSYSQPGFPQNLETFFPSPPPPPTTTSPSPSPPLQTTSSPPPSSSKTSTKSIITAVGVTAAITLILSAIAFLLCTRYLHSRRDNTANSMNNNNNNNASVVGGGRNPSRVLPSASPESEFSRFDGNLKGLIVDEGGLDVLYWRKLQGSKKGGGGSLKKETWETGKAAATAVMGIPRGKSSSSNSLAGVRAEKSGGNLDSYAPPPLPQRPSRSGAGGSSGHRLSSFAAVQFVNRQQQQQGGGGGGGGGMMTGRRLNSSSSSAVEWVKFEEQQGGGMSLMAVPRAQTFQAVAAPPPPPTTTRKPPPPPPPAPEKKAPAPPPPPPPGKGKPGGAAKPPPPPAPKDGSKVVAAVGGEGGEGSSVKEQVKMKPLHWEKVNVNPNHSMVWDKLDRGSFQYNGDMMEALFGVVAVNRKSPRSDDDLQNPAAAATSSSSKTFILDPRKSQNTAIVLKSLGIPRSELIEALQDGTGLTSETLEKLARIAPTADEQSKILAFSGDPATLADAEQFLHHLLRSVPTAFTRADAMLFKLTYDSELAALKESLRTLESACTELRGRGIFLKLLEAILKAGNRLNAGTARGDAKAFNLTTLLKLSDYKSSDGKTTLLHFVVHEVVRNEGRRCVLNKNNNNYNSLSRQGSRSGGTGGGDGGGSSSSGGDDSKSKDEQEKEFLRMGLPVVGGLSAEFSNVKKAAGIDYDVLTSTLVSLGTRVSETKRVLGEDGEGEGEGEGEGGFDKEMRGFIAAAEMELEGEMKVGTARVMELVKKTTKYYQAAAAANDKSPLRMFTIVNEFLGMVDRACVEIARSLQQRRKPEAAKTAAVGRSGSGGSESSSGASSPHVDDVLRTRVTFPRLPDHFLSDKSTSSLGSSSNGGGSDDDDDFLN